MPIMDLFESGEHRNNVAHFAAFVHLAATDGKIDRDVEILIKRFADKLDVSKEEYRGIVDNMEKYSLHPPDNPKKRLERLHDLFKIIYTNHYMNTKEQELVLRYAIELGFNDERAKEIIERSVKLFGGKIEFEEYELLLNSSKTNMKMVK